MATVTVAPASITLATVGATSTATVTVAGVSSSANANATFPVTIDGVIVNGTLTLQWPASVPSHGTPVLDAALTGRVTLTRTSVSVDGLSAVYTVTRTS